MAGHGSRENGDIERLKVGGKPNLIDGEEGQGGGPCVGKALVDVGKDGGERLAERGEGRGIVGKVKVAEEEDGDLCAGEALVELAEGGSAGVKRIGVLIVEGEMKFVTTDFETTELEGTALFIDEMECAVEEFAGMDEEHAMVEQLHALVGEMRFGQLLLLAEIDVSLDEGDDVGVEAGHPCEGLGEGSEGVVIGRPEKDAEGLCGGG